MARSGQRKAAAASPGPPGHRFPAEARPKGRRRGIRAGRARPLPAAWRVDYWDDPQAPKPTSRKPSASVVLRNHAGELLLLSRADSGRWTIPIGALKNNETLTACAIRECREETGLEVELTGLVGVFSDPRHRIAYDDGEVRVPVNVCFCSQPVTGQLATDRESDRAAWVAPEDLDDYDIHPAIRRRISHALHGAAPTSTEP